MSKAAPLGYVACEINLLQVDTIVDFDVYIWPDQGTHPVLYRSKKEPFNEEHRIRLIQANHSEVFVREEDAQAVHAYVERNLDRVISSDTLAIDEKARILYDTSIRLAQDILDRPDAHENFKRCGDLVRSTISYVMVGRHAVHQLLALKSHDYHTYTHSVNVCAIGLALAREIGMGTMEDLTAFGVGAIFHDVGKMQISQGILSKKGPLNETEWIEMRRHPLLGLDQVAPHAGFPDRGKAVIEQHHEWLDGRGYPGNRRSEEIDPFAKVAAIADVFDALTSRRPYKDAVDSYPALAIMKEEVGTHFEEEQYRAFVRLLGR